MGITSVMVVVMYQKQSMHACMYQTGKEISIEGQYTVDCIYL